MKKIIICIAILLCVALAAVILCNYFSVPAHVRTEDEGSAGTPSAESYLPKPSDGRIASALEAGLNYVMEDDGIDVPFSADLLRMIENHFEVDMEFIGAGVYQGSYQDEIVVELLLNPGGNVGQVQLCITEQASEDEITGALEQYVCFVNANLDPKTVSAVITEALPNIQDVKAGEPYLYYNHNVGFGAKVEDNQLFLYIP